MVLYDESGNYISNTNYSQIYLYCYAPAGDMSIVGTNTWLNAHGVDIDGDRAFCFYGKLWLLPAVKMNGDGSLKAESKWKTAI